MVLWAISDIHLSHQTNREEWAKLNPKPSDGLIIAGDVGETLQSLHEAFDLAVQCFSKVWWVPGNHELYSPRTPKIDETHMRGEHKYQACVRVAHEYGILTPEDDFVTWEYTTSAGVPEKALICPLFTLYDYSFRPAEVKRDDLMQWSMEQGILATDELLLHPDPHPSREQWCEHLVQQSETKLAKAQESGLPLVLINHWPLREDLVYIPLAPRFLPWCGTKLTKDWHTKYRVKVVITGHLHVPRTDWIDSVRFEEVSLGYPRQWQQSKDAGFNVNTLLREILPGPEYTPKRGEEPETQWRQFG